MKKISIAVILMLGYCNLTNAQNKNFIDQPYIEVSGFADTLVTPNLIYIKIVLSEKDSRDKISLEEQELKMLEALKTLGINTEMDLTTSDILSNYRFYLLKQKDIVKTKEYILKVTSAELASKVFVLLEDLDISNASIHRLEHANYEGLKNECRGKAILNAQKNALALTKPISQHIGPAIHIADGESTVQTALAGRAAGIQIRGVSQSSKAKWEPPKIEFEKIRISATVNAKYVLR